MKNLVPIIGLAPSELTIEALHARITLEHKRVQESLDEWIPNQNKPKTARAKSARKPKIPPELKLLCEELNMTPQEVLALLQKTKKED